MNINSFHRLALFKPTYLVHALHFKSTVLKFTLNRRYTTTSIDFDERYFPVVKALTHRDLGHLMSQHAVRYS